MMLSSFAFVGTAKAVAPDWDVTGTYVWDVFGTYFHDITITQDSSGAFTGTAGYPAGSQPYNQPGQTTETVTGQVTGSTITFTVTYLGPYAPGSVFNMTGTIDGTGKISGTSPWAWDFDGGVAVSSDLDGDGVLNWNDKCNGPSNDGPWLEGWGNNRWQVQGTTWYQNKVGKRGVTTPTPAESIAYTYGCNGHQILDLLYDAFGSVMNGHKKFGLSSSVREEFHRDMADGVLDGKYLIDTVVVNANSSAGSNSSLNLLNGYHYSFKASGTANAGDNINFDADYSFRTPTSSTWTDAVSTYEVYGDTLLDLRVNGGFVNWDNDAVYNPDHTYWYHFVGSGTSVNFSVYDVYYPNNTGSITVDIYAQI